MSSSSFKSWGQLQPNATEWYHVVPLKNRHSESRSSGCQCLNAALGADDSCAAGAWQCKRFIIYIPVVPARGGAEVALKIYMTFLIYRTCMRRAPAKPVRACTLRKWCPVSHVTFEAPLRPSHFSLHSSHSTLHTSHFTLHTSHFTLHSSQSTLHTSLRASHCTLHTSHFTLHTSHFTLHTSHCTLHAPRFTLHSSHSTLHLIWALLTLSQLISSHLISSHMSPKLSWITSQYYY